MKAPTRRAFLAAWGALHTTRGVGTAAALWGFAAHAQPVAAARTIDITARYFSYTPDEVVLQAGERAVLSFTTLDYMHGLHIPDLGIRADLVPGRVVRIELPLLRAGSYEFLCDNFCGEGHEDMHGRITVLA